MQPSQLEIQREVEALRDIRRRSSTQGGPGALILDPDLPNAPSPPSPTSNYWSSASTTPQLNDGDSSSGSHEDSSSSEDRAVSSDDPFHLFWVPARLHPEIAPAEFRAFLKEHAPSPDGPSTLSRSATTTSPGLERKRSMLSRQYKPSENDDVEEETIVPIRRNRSVLVRTGPQLTINDLQRLEELAEEATKDGDPSKFRTVLRRSLSLNVSPSAIDRMDDIPPIPDEADAPIIIPPPGQILRRAARTKIRKSFLPADVEGRGFSGRRRRPAAKVAEPRTSSDLSSNDHATEQTESVEQTKRVRTFSNESITSDEQTFRRSDPYGEETSIYDAYVREDPDSEIMHSMQFMASAPALSLTLSADDSKSSSADVAPEPPLMFPTRETGLELQHPQPQRANLAASIEETPRTPSPDTTLVPTEETAVASSFADIPAIAEKSVTPAQKKEKDRKGLFGKWGSSDKNGKKSAKAEREREKEAQRAEKEKEKEKESGFFGSLFSSKKKQDDSSSQASGFSGSGRETATALLGASKSSKGLSPSPSPQPGLNGPYARYPIHVERAIYRLSHIKLANPRRPLYEQVLISNLMFWYLGVINKTQNPAPAASQTQATAGTSPGQEVPEQEEAEGREVEEQQRAENERLEREKQERERERERELQLQQQQQREKSRRGTLTKTNPAQQGARRAGEMLVKGPQYEMQHRVMEQEYHGPVYGYGSPPPSPGVVAAPRIHRQASPPINQPQSMEPDLAAYMYPSGKDPQLPPGAMSPSSNSLSTSPAASRSRPPSSSPPPNGPIQADSPQPSHRSRSPPAQNHNRYSPPAPGRPQPSRGPTRSLSATVTSGVPLSADGKARKVVSAHAVVPNGRPRASMGSVPASRSEEEDVPLAVYQQQRRR
ncbi:hypothetical protein JVU11DRAFT_6220 [Chiua virens]|nr:hypothetical protein JVU11DRAFT_6220 [Chiua virens]